ncbi:phospholipase D1-like [Anarhichas minor]|uniref:phospholipase D1-like n=1 Tax=Anarhichas minor TaxID=65739 RepID=UPI003F735F6B
MNRGEHSIMSQLKREMGDQWINYISIAGLRTHAELEGKLVTRAHLRPQQDAHRRRQHRHHRFCQHQRPEHAGKEGQRGGGDRGGLGDGYGGDGRAGVPSWKIRSMILGANTDPSIDVSDPVSDQFYKVWMTTCARNATIYQKVFRSLPSSDVRSILELEGYLAKPGLD